MTNYNVFMNWKTKFITKWDEAKRFIHFVIDHFLADDCTYRASALAFTSLLAIVPLMSVGLAIFSSFPVFAGLSGPAQDFIFENFVPATGKVLQSYLQQFTLQVSKLSVFGVIFLFITALLVMVTIERSLNKIWRVHTPRKGVSAFLLYWAILSLAPIFLGLSLAVSSYVISMPFIRDHHPPSMLLSLIPSILSLTGFTFLYVVVPNCPVKFRDGLYGGIIATLLFEMAKQAFAQYLTRYNTYELLYGAFATVPIFFIWVYWVWVITLLGAEISYAFSVHYERRTGKSLDGFLHALRWLYALWVAQKKGKGLTLDELVNTSDQAFAVDINEMIDELTRSKLIHETCDGQYMLSGDLNQITLYSLSQKLPYRLPTKKELAYAQPSIERDWCLMLEKNNKVLKKTLGVNLQELFKGVDIAQVDDNT